MPQRRITISSGFENNYLLALICFCIDLSHKYFYIKLLRNSEQFFGQFIGLDYFFVIINNC